MTFADAMREALNCGHEVDILEDRLGGYWVVVPAAAKQWMVCGRYKRVTEIRLRVEVSGRLS